MTSYIAYNSQGVKIKGSVIRDDGGSVNTTIRLYNTGTDYLTDRLYKDSIVLLNGNMKEAYRKNSGQPFFTFFYDSIDNRTNPYRVLNIATAYFKRNLYFSVDWSQNARKGFQGNFNMQSINTNNIVKWRLLNYTTGTPPWPWYYTSQYTYNTDGYPETQDLLIKEGTETGVVYNHLRYSYLYD